MKRKIGLASLALLMIASMCMPVSAWGYLAHQDAADEASEIYYTPGSTTYNTIHTASNTPDGWGVAEKIYHGPYGPVAASDRATKAHNALFHGGAGDWAQEYGYATHYMTDMSMPWHTSLTHTSVLDGQRHELCEIAVHDYRYTYWALWMNNAGTGSFSNPYSAADSLKSQSAPAADTLYSIMETNSNYASDPTYQSIIGNLLRKATQNNKGMINWVKSSSN